MVARKVRLSLRVKRYFKENPGAFFVVCFQALLLVCAGLLIWGNSVLADGVAVWAYFSLVVGVLLQLFSFVRHGKGAEEKDDEW